MSDTAPSIGTRDISWSLLIIVLGAVALLPGIFDLTFFRHTEADRALIGWAMFEDRDFIIPHLLGDQYLTKPPLFYLILATSYALFGTVAEWTARVPSVLAGSLLLGVQFLAARGLGYSRNIALLSAFVLATTASFYRYGTQSEIDMVFSANCTVANYALLFAVFSVGATSRFKVPMLALAYGLLSIALLIKGPTAVLFFGSILFSLLLFRESRVSVSLYRHGILGLGALVPLLAWLLLFVYRTSWGTLIQIFNEELLQRVSLDASNDVRPRDALFYLYSIPLTMLPWSGLYLLFLLSTAWEGIKRYFQKATPTLEKGSLRSPPSSTTTLTRVLVTSCIISLLVCSMSSGKSARYLFPLIPFLSLLLTIGIVRCFELNQQGIKTLVRILFAATGILAPLALLGTTLYLIWTNSAILQDIDSIRFVLCLGVVSFLALFLTTVPKETSWGRIFILAYLLVIVIRFTDVSIATPYQNSQYKVREVAEQLHSAVPPGKTLYTLEMFERWICFYYIQGAGEVKRLTPAIATEYATPDKAQEDVYLLLNKEEEGWRLPQLLAHDDKTNIVMSIPSKHKVYLLVRTSGGALQYTKPRKLFPTNRTVAPEFADKKDMQKEAA
jgi:4-amino-4-deoxy-L-arabinose transferase-like glycosyltransferase